MRSRPTAQPGQPGQRAERGAALLVVMVAVAILTALSVQLAYDTRVELQIAGNARDQLRAEYLAKSGVALSRLVLSLQEQIDGATQPSPGVSSSAKGASKLPVALAMPSIRLWSVVPVSSGLVQALFGGGGAPAATAAAEPESAPQDGPRAEPLAVARFGDFDGAFAATIEDEGSKVNAQLDALDMSGRLGPQVVGLWQLVCDPRWDLLFDREDANGQRVSRQDLVMHLRDWADDDDRTSTLVAGFPGPACMILSPPNPFEPGFGDEDAPYDRGDDRYKAKSARFDSLEELHLVAGVTDAFMAAFGNRLTVYVPREAKRTIDPMNPAGLLELAMAIADPPGQPILYDPEFATLLQRTVLAQSMGGLLGLSGAQFAQLVVALGVQVSAAASDPASPQNFLGDRSSVYRIRATGAAGDVEAHIDAVVSFDPTQTRGGPPPGQNAGRLIRWREE
jgi:general secretion pathway protein K